MGCFILVSNDGIGSIKINGVGYDKIRDEGKCFGL